MEIVANRFTFKPDHIHHSVHVATYQSSCRWFQVYPSPLSTAVAFQERLKPGWVDIDLLSNSTKQLRALQLAISGKKLKFFYPINNYDFCVSQNAIAVNPELTWQYPLSEFVPNKQKLFV